MVAPIQGFGLASIELASKSIEEIIREKAMLFLRSRGIYLDDTWKLLVYIDENTSYTFSFEKGYDCNIDGDISVSSAGPGWLQVTLSTSNTGVLSFELIVGVAPPDATAILLAASIGGGADVTPHLNIGYGAVRHQITWEYTNSAADARLIENVNGTPNVLATATVDYVSGEKQWYCLIVDYNAMTITGYYRSGQNNVITASISTVPEVRRLSIHVGHSFTAAGSVSKYIGFPIIAMYK